ncbi:hypothetical protein RDI58_007141 [Solanum bulbocastanum]|uniref:RNase H type-1 domain-containing protein n=1 Tax=Solanum bulbocastanum TaxID=147425 RepID=A0AAN8TZT3_SOLBU
MGDMLRSLKMGGSQRRQAASNPNVGGIGGVFRDRGGHWILGFSERTHKTNPAMAELQALRRGL